VTADKEEAYQAAQEALGADNIITTGNELVVAR
jgi:hypothetical protein